MLEKDIETRFVNEVNKRIGIVVKFTPTGQDGYADRQLLLPGGRVVFVELKKPGEKPEPLQLYRAKKLKALGFKTYFIDSYELINDFIREVYGS